MINIFVVTDSIMADETLFDFLHSEVVNYVIEKNENEHNSKDSKVLIYHLSYCDIKHVF